MASITEIGELMNKVVELYPSVTITKFLVETWFDCLQDAPIERVNAALKEYAAAERYAPKASDIRTRALKACGGRFKRFDSNVISMEEWKYRCQKNEEAGIVPCFRDGKFLGWEPKDYSCKRGNRWRLIVDWAIEKLGSYRVSELYKEWAREHNLIALGNVAKSIPSRAFPTQEYKQFLSMILDLSDSEEIRYAK